MKIAIDLRPLQIGHQNRGIGAYLLNILNHFPQTDDVEYIFLRYETSNPIIEFDIGANRKFKEIVFRKYDFKPNPKQAILFFYGLMLPRYLSLLIHRPDVFFQTDYLLGIPNRLLAKKTVTTCYDIIPLKFKSMYIPNWHRFAGMRHLRLRSRVRQSIRAIYYARKYRKGVLTLRKSDTVLSISKTTTTDLVTIAKIDQKMIRTIYLAPSYRKPTDIYLDKGIEEKLPKPYIFYIGGGDRRRQIPTLISAFNKLNGHGHIIDLVLAGNEFTEDNKEATSEVKSALNLSSYRHRIHLLGSITEHSKLQIMKNCRIFVYPSLYEGFGMPIVEAMFAGTPVISYKNSSIEEIAQSDIFYAQESSDGIYDAVLNVLAKSPAEITEIVNRARSSASKFTWESTGLKTWEAIVALIS